MHHDSIIKHKHIAIEHWTGSYVPHYNACLLAPVQTIFPELKMSAVVLGSLILMMTAAKRYNTT